MLSRRTQHSSWCHFWLTGHRILGAADGDSGKATTFFAFFVDALVLTAVIIGLLYRAGASTARGLLAFLEDDYPGQVYAIFKSEGLKEDVSKLVPTPQGGTWHARTMYAALTLEKNFRHALGRVARQGDDRRTLRSNGSYRDEGRLGIAPSPQSSRTRSDNSASPNAYRGYGCSGDRRRLHLPAGLRPRTAPRRNPGLIARIGQRKPTCASVS